MKLPTLVSTRWDQSWCSSSATTHLFWPDETNRDASVAEECEYLYEGDGGGGSDAQCSSHDDAAAEWRWDEAATSIGSSLASVLPRPRGQLTPASCNNDNIGHVTFRANWMCFSLDLFLLQPMWMFSASCELNNQFLDDDYIGFVMKLSLLKEYKGVHINWYRWQGCILWLNSWRIWCLMLFSCSEFIKLILERTYGSWLDKPR